MKPEMKFNLKSLWESTRKADKIWYVGVATAIVASVMTHNFTGAFIIFGLHMLRDWLDLQNRVDHNERLDAIELKLKDM